ncbi:MAG: hypothetical protein LBU43_07270, partial [Candidatus Accumulibacter sp.]|nr:hypothetical protein [Accumulibacter sp.]
MLASQALPTGQQIVAKRAGAARNHHFALHALEQREQLDMLIVGQLAVKRNFRRYLVRYEEEGEAGLEDKRLECCVARGAPVDEVLAVRDQYR